MTTEFAAPPKGTLREYTNPVGYTDGIRRTNPDPFVLRFRGRYWCYSSGHDGVNVSVSDDLVHWESAGLALQVPGRDEFWAPCVIYAQGKFWMYFSNRPAGGQDPHEEVLQLAVSSTPEGPFEVRRRFFDKFSIDPHVIRDSRTGEYVMFYSTNDVTGLETERTGTSIIADRMLAMDELAGHPVPVVVPTLDEEIFERNRFGDGRDWHTIEGASYVTRRDTAFLTYSGNAYTGEYYFIGYSRAPLTGAPDILDWTKYPDDYHYAPLVRRNETVEGTGHNSIIAAPNLVDDWMVYHGRDADEVLDISREQRVMRIDPIRYDAGRMTTSAPSSSPASAPAAATFADHFTHSPLDRRWDTLAGNFTLVPASGFEPGSVRTGRDPQSTIVSTWSGDRYVAEVTLRAHPHDAGARLGFIPMLHDENSYVSILFDVASRSVTARQVRGRMGLVIAQATLESVDLKDWHLLRVERQFGDLSVSLDGHELLTINTEDARPAPVGLISVSSTAEFSGFSLTDHLDLYGDGLRHLPHVYEADGPTEIRAEGVGSATCRPLTLTAVEPCRQISAAHEFEVLTPTGFALLELATPDGRTAAQLRLNHKGYRLTITSDGTDHLVAEEPLESGPCTAWSQIRDGAIEFQLGAKAHLVSIDTSGGLNQRLELVGATLRGLETTSLMEDDGR